jgi:hypothetical protein
MVYFDRIAFTFHAEVAELADALRSGRSELNAHVGSNPTFGTRPAQAGFFILFRLKIRYARIPRHRISQRETF